MESKKNIRQIQCLHCEDFYEFIPGETKDFMETQADKKYISYLTDQVPFVHEFPGGERIIITSIFQFVDNHCPYCREVVFGIPDDEWLPSFTVHDGALRSLGFHEIEV